DREKLADEIARVAGGGWWGADDDTTRATRTPYPLTRSFYIQVNTGEEAQKAGVAPKDADALIAYCRKLKLPVAGLMTIPPTEQPPAPHFALLNKIADRNGLKE